MSRPDSVTGSLVDWINQNVPDGREKSLAITKLEEAMMWTNAAIARPPRPDEGS